MLCMLRSQNVYCQFHKYVLLCQRLCWFVDVRYEALSPGLLLNNANREKFIGKLKEMKTVRLSPNIPTKRAAVFVPLCVVRNEVAILYTLRAADLKNYRGQVSFPGGVQDKADKTLQQTAVRETCEELGIVEDKIEIWGHGAFVGTKHQDMAVMPFVGFIGDLDIQHLQLNPKEVESAFTVPLKSFCNPRNCRSTQFRNGYVLPVFIGGQHRIWGMTAIITYYVLHALLPQEMYRHKLMHIEKMY